jgi:hypothetical protein
MLATIYAWYDMAHAVKPAAEDAETLLGVARLVA